MGNYVSRTDVMTLARRAADYEAWAMRYCEVLKNQKGFVARIVANSLGQPAKYTALLVWESREAARNAVRGAEVDAFFKANSFEGLATVTRPIEAYENILSVVADTAPLGSFYVLAEWNLDWGKQSAFETRCQEVFELRKKIGGGFYTNRLRRYLGNLTKYLINTTYKDRESITAALAHPELQEFNRTHPNSSYASTPPIIEAYELIQRWVRPSV
jgi:heme-degrading monooxygenase HmoA